MLNGPYTRCSAGPWGTHICKELKKGGKCESPLHQPQCFRCRHWRQADNTCKFYGWLEDCCGCCGKYEPSELEWCFHGWAQRRDWGLDCGKIDEVGCEKCQEDWFRDQGMEE